MVSFKPFLSNFQSTVILLILWIKECTSKANISPCNYPVYRETEICGIQDSQILDGFFCDPDSTVSMSEMHLIDESLRRIYRSKQDKCVCTDSVSQQCWFKFGFAFMREITPIEGYITDLHSSDHCPINSSDHQISAFNSMSQDSFQNYGKNYARIIRERWNFGECGEDILVFLIQRRPRQLSSHSGRAEVKPIIFLSHGSLVQEKLTSLEAFPGTHSSSHNTFQHVIEDENSKLQNGYPLNRVLISLVERIVAILKKAEELPRYPQKRHQSVPFWAWCTFGACGICCILMTIGLCWIRSTSRRQSQRTKPGIVANGRAWKAGFGDDQPTTNTNVNLVQMLFPRPQQANV